MIEDRSNTTSTHPAAQRTASGGPSATSAPGGDAMSIAGPGTRAGGFGAVAIAIVAVGVAAVAAIELDVASGWAALGVVIAWSSAAAVVGWQRASEPTGLVAAAVPATVALVVATAAFDDRGILHGLAIGALLIASGGFVTVAPDGRPARAVQRRGLIVVALLGAATACLLAVAAPDVPAAVMWVASAGVGVTACSTAFVACQGAGTLERARLQWIGWGITVCGVAIAAVLALAAVSDWPADLRAAVIGICAVPALGLAATASRRALGMIADVLVTTIVAAGLLAFVAAVYLIVVIGLNGTPDDGERTVLVLSILAALVVAATVVPVQRRLHAAASQRVFGDDDAPDQALERFTTRMSRAIPMDELLLQLVESIRGTMKTTSAEVWTGSDGVYESAVSVPHRVRPRITLEPDVLSVAARAHVQGNAWLAVWIPRLLDDRGESAVRFTSVSHLGELLGFIVTERPAGTVELNEDDEHRVLIDIARQLGLALHNVRLDNALQASLDDLKVVNAELVASRARIVAATDESRRKIERDLHDGAQQHLVALAVKVGLIQQLLDVDRDTALTMLTELRGDVQATLTELRELAHGIYPPRLRDRGLPDALAAAGNRSTLPVTVHAEGLGRYGQDIETAVYFCCLEAIQNAGKYAGDGASVEVTVREDGDVLEFTVSDDGVGFDADSVSLSHGFVNMRDRIGAFTGSLAVVSAPGSGTRIVGRVPLT